MQGPVTTVQETKGIEVHLVTAENYSSIVTQWKDSKLFDFGALYQEEGIVAPLFMVHCKLNNGKPQLIYHIIMNFPASAHPSS